MLNFRRSEHEDFHYTFAKTTPNEMLLTDLWCWKAFAIPEGTTYS